MDVWDQNSLAVVYVCKMHVAVCDYLSAISSFRGQRWLSHVPYVNESCHIFPEYGVKPHTSNALSLGNGLCVATPKSLSLGTKFSRCCPFFLFFSFFLFSNAIRATVYVWLHSSQLSLRTKFSRCFPDSPFLLRCLFPFSNAHWATVYVWLHRRY